VLCYVIARDKYATLIRDIVPHGCINTVLNYIL
jgi:hypothetical protein